MRVLILVKADLKGASLGLPKVAQTSLRVPV
jgi:hypothetical protein